MNDLFLSSTLMYFLQINFVIGTGKDNWNFFFFYNKMEIFLYGTLYIDFYLCYNGFVRNQLQFIKRRFIMKLSDKLLKALVAQVNMEDRKSVV